VAGQRGALCRDFLHGQGAPLALAPGVQGVAAVGAVGVADIGQINGGVEPDGPAEVLAGETVGHRCHLLQERQGAGGEQGRQVFRGRLLPAERPLDLVRPGPGDQFRKARLRPGI